MLFEVWKMKESIYEKTKEMNVNEYFDFIENISESVVNKIKN